MISGQGSPISRPDSGQNVPLVHPSAIQPLSARSNDSNSQPQRSHLHSG